MIRGEIKTEIICQSDVRPQLSLVSLVNQKFLLLELRFHNSAVLRSSTCPCTCVMLFMALVILCSVREFSSFYCAKYFNCS